ncbi:alpha/beta hydrolase [Enterovibrio norvegicus]|uniref:Alpha/beta hydrolase n=2 Tax=Enterovibrio norvegicus TaxID=188144 RepID=A0A2N7L3D3_9GAMM|nr:alpha/beta hydrolase [Enterovibrio norvegicus]
MRKRLKVSLGLLFVGLVGLSTMSLTATNSTVSALQALKTDEVSFLEAGDVDAPQRIIFIHGSPGSKEGYEDYLNDAALQSYHLIAVDRPGFGASPKPVQTSLKAQAESLMPILVRSDKPTFLVGHSLGGPIALQAALLYPDEIDGALLVAPALDPALESPKWYNYLADTILAHWILPNDMLLSNIEMMELESELEKLAEQDWEALSIPVVLVHGEEDDIADPGNSLFGKRKLPSSTLKMIEDEGHFVLWQNVPLLVGEIKALLAVPLLHEGSNEA